MNTIITIGRQYGSAGREIGKKVAENFGIKYYDKDLITRVAKESGYCEEMIAHNDERPTNSFLYNLVMDTYSFGYNSSSFVDMPLSHKIFLAQFDTIKKVADEGPCVIVGRCADYVLRDYPNVMSVFVHADEKFCFDRAMERNSMSAHDLKKYIAKIDKYRGDYYKYYTGQDWTDARNYDLCLNSGKLGFEKCMEEILAYRKVRFGV